MMLGVVDPVPGDDEGEAAAGSLPELAEPGAEDLVRLGDIVVSLAVLRARPELFAQAYEHTKATVGYAECLCTGGDAPEKLVIRARSGRHHVACWPGRRGAHAAHCHFHQSDHLSGRSRYAAAIEEDLDGVRIHLEVALTLNLTEARRQPTLPARGENGGESRGAMTLLGLLHHLWERSSLNRWPGRRGHRGWRECVRHLTEAIDETTLDHTPLTQILHLVRPYSPETANTNAAAFDRFAGQLGRHGKLVRHGLLLGEVRALEATRHNWRLALRQTKTPVYVDEALVARLKRSYPAVFSAARPEAARQVVLLVVNRTPRGHLRLVDGAAMLCSTHYVPVESGYEFDMAAALVAAGRGFVKPLRYDLSDDLLPDFVLVDVTPHVAVEVWGVKGRALYDLRRRAKLQLYNDRAATLPLLQWDVAQPLPDLQRP